MGDTPTIPMNGEEWSIERFIVTLRSTQPATWAQLHWRIYLLVHSDEHEQSNMTAWLWSWEWLMANDGQELPGIGMTL